MDGSVEVQFAQTLASNDKKFRDKALKRLRTYISVRSSGGEGMNHDDFIKLWKGLHYCMWMQDKPVIQEELSAKLADLLHAFPKLQDALRFVNAFFVTEAREWNGLDRLRLDKFMMLIRDILHETFVLLSDDRWPISECQSFSQYLKASVMNEANAKLPHGLKMHISDIFISEMRKVSLEGMNSQKLTILMFPFVYFLLKSKRYEFATAVYEKTIKFVLSAYGIWAWQINRKQKLVAGDEDQEMECENLDEKDEPDEKMDIEKDDSNKPKKLKFDLSQLLRLMFQLAEDPKVQNRNRKRVYSIVRSYSKRDPNILQRSENVAENVVVDEDDVDINIFRQFMVDVEDQKKSKRKRKRRGEEADEHKSINNTNNGNVGEVILEKCEEKSTKQKKQKNNTKLKTYKANEDKNVEQENLAPTKVKNKKRKQLSVDGNGVADCSNLCDNKKLKIEEVDDDSNVPVENGGKMEKCNKVKAVDNFNTNALSPPKCTPQSKPKKKALSLSASMAKFVVYPQKTKTPISATQLPQTRSESPSHSVPARAVSKETSATTPDQLFSPGGSKKVVFDLRKNMANNFKDYVKSLANPSPAFEPNKSPSQGILKPSPASSVLSSESLNTPKSKRKPGLALGKAKIMLNSHSPKNQMTPSPAGKSRRKGLKSPK